jgi:hypothetical protein
VPAEPAGVLLQTDQGHSVTTLIRGRQGELLDRRVFAQVFVHLPAERPCAFAVDHLHIGQTAQNGLIDELGQFVHRFIRPLAPKVETRGSDPLGLDQMARSLLPFLGLRGRKKLARTGPDADAAEIDLDLSPFFILSTTVPVFDQAG